MNRFEIRNDFEYFKAKYPHISFHYNKDKSEGKLKNMKYIFASEGYITVPQSYNIDVIKDFKGFVNFNSKYKTIYGKYINIIPISGYPDWNNYYPLEEQDFVPYDKKFNGICCLNNIYKTTQKGDILYLREQVFQALPMPKHSYGPVAFGRDNYQGKGGSPSTKEAQSIIAKYRYCLALEPMYHSLWSYDWITERMWNAFRAKTVPVYFGGYNVEAHVPTDLFVDLRKYVVSYQPKITFDYRAIVKALNAISKEQYITMTEKAYEWQKHNTYGDIGGIDKILEALK